MKLEEKIARMIDPAGWAVGPTSYGIPTEDDPRWKRTAAWAAREVARDKARAILALLPASAERDGALEEAANAFREAVIKSGALNYVKQDTYFDQLRALECALAKSTPPKPAVADDVVEIIAAASYEEAVSAGRAILREKYPDWLSLPEKHREAGRKFGRFIADRLASANLLRSTPVQTDTAIEAGWRPIETAPKDGTPVLVHVASVKGDGVSYVAWYNSSKQWAFFQRAKPDETFWVYPTHWMPLPASPNQEKAQ